MTGPKGRVESIDVEFQSTSLKGWFLGNWIPKGGSDTPSPTKRTKMITFREGYCNCFYMIQGKETGSYCEKRGLDEVSCTSTERGRI